jgi:hypothetical protein
VGAGAHARVPAVAVTVLVVLSRGGRVHRPRRESAPLRQRH